MRRNINDKDFEKIAPALNVKLKLINLILNYFMKIFKNSIPIQNIFYLLNPVIGHIFGN